MALPVDAVEKSPLLRALSAHDSKLIKQGAEAKVYRAHLVSGPVRLFLPEDQSGGAAASTSRAVQQPQPTLLKYRFPKRYRHPSLSESVTAQRTVSEARALVRCARNGVNVPGVVAVDEKSGILALEWIEGRSVRELLGGGAEEDEAGAESAEDDVRSDAGLEEMILTREDLKLALMTLVGQQLAVMHATDVVHGDLTTSNMMVRPRKLRTSAAAASIPLADALSHLASGAASSSSIDVVLIDFGLSSNSSTAEDKAVDLYVLERAFLSTHPNSHALFQRVLDSYGEHVELLWRRGDWRRAQTQTTSSVAKAGGRPNANKVSKQQRRQQGHSTASSLMEAAQSAAQAVADATAALKEASITVKSAPASAESPWRDIQRRLEEVRLRGRKRSMVG
ncbi:unnamed protein product [Parajaminaea phylloscopi]